MKTLFSIIGLILVSILVIVVASSIFLWILFCFLGAIGIFFLVWACGMHIKVKSAGFPIGYIRWFTYYPYRK